MKNQVHVRRGTTDKPGSGQDDCHTSHLQQGCLVTKQSKKKALFIF